MKHHHSIKASPIERRRYTRTPVGLPVRVHFTGRTIAQTFELRDVSFLGCYFTGVLAPQSTKFAFGFRLANQQVCVAAGRVLRVDRNGFAATLSRTSEAFAEFMDRLSGPVTTRVA